MATLSGRAAAGASAAGSPKAAAATPRAADATAQYTRPRKCLPCNTALQHEAAAFLAQKRAVEAAASAAHAGTTRRSTRRDTTRDGFVSLDGGQECVAFPPSLTAAFGVDTTEGVNPCTCSKTVFDGWLRAVVVSIPSPADAVQQQHHHPDTMHSRAAVTMSREHALYAALELLECAARLLQRRLAVSHSHDRLLQAYYSALEEDIDVAAPATTGTVVASELKPTAFHRSLRSRKRAVPLQHYSSEQGEMEARLEKVYYVLRKLEEMEGLSNSILIEGREALHGAAAATASTRGEEDAALASRENERSSSSSIESDQDGSQEDAADTEDGSGCGGARKHAAAGAAPSRRLVAIERRVRRMRRQLNLPLAPAEITSRLRNELILSFSARVLALREPAPFTPETHTRRRHVSPPSNARAPRDRHTHSISAFVEWYVQHIMDPPAMSQLLSIVPHEFVVTTSCRLVCACEAHASLRASRALPDLGAVLLRAVAEGRGDAIAQLILSSSVSYGSALEHAVHNPTCFYAGLVGGQLDVLGRLVEQQCWDAEALHVLLFTGAPWNRASATHGCHAYNQATASRIRRVIQLAERGLQRTHVASGMAAASSSSAAAGEGRTPFTRTGSRSASVSAASDNESDDSFGGKAEEAGGEAAANAVAALRAVHLLDSTSAADGMGTLQAVRTVLVTSRATAGASSAPSRMQQRGREASSSESHAGSPTKSLSDGEREKRREKQPISAIVVRGGTPRPGVCLDGGLQRLRLYLAARNGTLRYESRQQDAQWAALLKQTPSLSATVSRRQAGQGTGSVKSGASTASDAAESTFAAVLRHRQLDALSPVSVCPVRCQLCPAFSTPSLQRVDALSFGPLQPTTMSFSASNPDGQSEREGVVMSDEDGANDGKHPLADEAGGDSEKDAAGASASGGCDSSGPHTRPVRALLLRADTAIEAVPEAWQAYLCTPPSASTTAAVAGTSSAMRSVSPLSLHEELTSASSLSTSSVSSPWRASAITMQSTSAPRYAATHAVEESLLAVQSAKQRHARHTLYGFPGSISGGAELGSAASIPHDGGLDGEEAGAGGADLNAISRFLSSSSAPLTTARGFDRHTPRSVYFEVHLSLNYILALYDPVSVPGLPADGPAARAVSANGVVVGLCDDAAAATANGCTRGPHQPYPVAHLGHTCNPVWWRSDGAFSLGSAGVSVSVVAHYTNRDDTAASGVVASEVVLLAVWLHTENAVTPVLSGTTPVYLRLEMPRCVSAASSTAAAAAASTAAENNGEEEDAEVVADNLAGPAGGGGDTTQSSESANATTVLLPTLSRATLADVRDAVNKMRQHGGSVAPDPREFAAHVFPATLVVGLLYTPASDTLRFRLNNYVHAGEVSLGLSLPAHASAAAAPTVRLQRLYPAATLSLDEGGWGRWYSHQTTMWAGARQRRPGTVQATPYPPTVAGAESGRCAAPAVSNAVVYFAFEPFNLLYGPPLTASTASGAAASRDRRLAAPHRRPRPELIGLLDASCKFSQLLQVLTNVASLAGLSSSSALSLSGSTVGGGSGGSGVSGDSPPGLGDGGLTASGAGGAAVPFFGSRDRRVRDAMTRVQELLNAPAAEGMLFFPPVRIYRHSSHCPPQDLYPLPPSPDAAAVERADAKTPHTDGTQRQHQRRGGASGTAGAPPMRRQLGMGLSMPSPLNSANAHLHWHEVIPENARLTPLCAALAARQPAMAYAICTHPLTSFCDVDGDAQHSVQQQQQQRRTALYACCALGYADVLAVLLERIPAEELLSYFGIVIESEARAALQQSYIKAEALLLRSYRLNMLSATPSPQQPQSENGRDFGRSGAKPYGTNACQRSLLDVSALYATARSLYTPLHVAMLGAVHEADDDVSDSDSEDDDDDAGGGIGSDEEQRRVDELLHLNATSSPLQHVRGLRRQTACATLLLNCLYDLLLVAATTGTTTSSNSAAAVAIGGGGNVGGTTAGRTGLIEERTGRANEESVGHSKRGSSAAAAELLASALNLQSRAGETALLLAVRHNNCSVATRLLRLGAQAACMDRVTHLFTLELACANRCSPMAEALLSGPSSPYATSPVLLNHAGIATALCWCAINNMHAVLEMLLSCEGVDVSAGFEGSSPLHLAITFGSEEAALALLSGTQPKIAGAAAAAAAATGDASERPKTRPLTRNEKTVTVSNMTTATTAAQTRRQAAAPHPTPARIGGPLSSAGSHRKPFMDVNVPHERSRCTALHLACERGQLRVIRALLQTWHAQLNTAAANTNYTPLLSALANGREDAALRVLEYSKDELRRGRAVLDLTAIDQNGDTALHLAARRGLVLAMEYMLAQFCEEEVTRLAQLHPQLAASPAFLTATCMVPLYAVNKQGKSALLVAIQYDQADAAEMLLSTFVERHEESEMNRLDKQEDGAATSLFTGALIDGTCMALHQAFKKRMHTAVDLMLSTPSSAALFPSSAAFREAMQQHAEERRGNRIRSARGGHANDDDDEAAAVQAKRQAAGHNRSSFVRLLLTRAAGPTISPSDALRLLLGGFVLPELCVYLSDVAAESAVLGVQHGTAMAYAELLMGYLQEHASLVVAPTRMVVFCRDLWGCLQSWMRDKAQHSAQQQQHREREARLRKHGAAALTPTGFHRSMRSAEGVSRCDTASPSAALHKRAALEEVPPDPPMVWLCRALLPSAAAAAAGNNTITTAGQRATAASATTADDAAGDYEAVAWREAEAKKCGEALRTALNRKTLSLDIVRVIRLYGSTAGGVRAIEEIEGLVRAFVSAKANARARQMRRQPATTTAAAAASGNTPSKNSNEEEASAAAKPVQSDCESSHASAATSTTEASMTSAAAMIASTEADVGKEIIGDEVLFTTPVGFTVLQLAAALGLTEVVAFLVDRYHLDPLYAPSQDLYAEAEADAMAGQFSHGQAAGAIGSLRVAGAARASILASASSPLFASLNAAVTAAAVATSGREEEERFLRILNGQAVRAVAQLAAAAAPAAATSGGGHAMHGNGSTSRASLGGLADNSSGGSGHGSADGAGGGAGNGGSGDGAGSRTWFYWTPYRLAVRTGNTDVVRTLLRSAASGARSQERHQKRREENTNAAAAAAAPRPHGSHIVDFKEPQWVDGFQRTALQECIAVIASASVASSRGTAAAATDSAADGPPQPNGRVAAEVAAADMVALLLRHGAQPNGLFDVMGCDAWMLALTGSGTDGFVHAVARVESGKTDEGVGGAASASSQLTSVSVGSGVEACLDLLLRFHTPLLGRTPESSTLRAAGAHVGGSAKLKASVGLPDEGPHSDAAFDEQLVQGNLSLLRRWKRLSCMRASSSAAEREKLAYKKRQQVVVAASSTPFTFDGNGGTGIDEGGWVFDVAESLCAAYRRTAQENGFDSTAGGAPQANFNGSFVGDLSVTNLNQPALASFLAFGQHDADSGLLSSDVGGGGGNLGNGPTAASPKNRTNRSSSLWKDDEDHPLSDNAPTPQHPSATLARCRDRMTAALRLCYRVVLLYQCADHAPQQMLRLVHAYTLDVIPMRARHPFSGDTIVTRLLRTARERLLSSGATPTENEVGDMLSRVVEGDAAAEAGDPVVGNNNNNTTTSGAQASAMTWTAPQQRAYRDPTEDPAASILIQTTLAIIHQLPVLTHATDPSVCAMLQSLLYQPSFDTETALSLAARLAHVPLISSIVQSAASPELLAEVASAKPEWEGSKRASLCASQCQSEAAAGGENGLAEGEKQDEDVGKSTTQAPNASPPLPSASPYSLSTNLTYVMVRVLLATRVYYPAHEIITVRILLRSMPDEASSLAFLRWVYPNVHPLPALQLAMDHVDVAAHFLTCADCMNALWANLLYAHFTRQLDTTVRATSKAWNALLKVVLPGAPAVPIYLVLRGSLQLRSGDAADQSYSEATARMTSVTTRQSSASVHRRPGSQRAKKVQLTNWSYLIRRTTIFLQLMSMSVAETLMKKTTGGSSGGGGGTSASKGVGAAGGKWSRGGQQDGKESAAEGAVGTAAAAATGGDASQAAALASHGLAGTLLLDTLELAVRFDDKEVLALLMQLHMPDVVIKYVTLVQQQQQQQQAVNASTFPVSLAAQSATARALEVTAAAVSSSFPSFVGVRTMTQAGTVLDRLQRLLWRDAIQERHLDLIAVLAGAVRTLRGLYTSPHADVAALLTPMRYDRIDLKTGNPEGVVSVRPPQPNSQISPHSSPGVDFGASMTSARSPVEAFNATQSQSERRYLPLSVDTSQRDGTMRSTPTPAIHKATPRSAAEREDEEEQRFMESVIRGDRLAPHEERRRRVTTVTWGIGAAALPLEVPPGRAGSASAAAPNGGGGGHTSDSEQESNSAGADQLSPLTPPALPLPWASLLGPSAPAGGATAGRRADPPTSVRPPSKTGTAAVSSVSAAVPYPRSRKAAGQAESDATKLAPRVAVPTLHLPVPPAAAAAVATPSRAVHPVYFMYLQLDWAMFSTRLLRSPQPSTATVDTVLYLLEHRCALSVPVLDLFLSGLTVSSMHAFADAASLLASAEENSAVLRSVAMKSEAGGGDRSTTVTLSLRYRTRRHRDTLLHLLVLHDQCQLAEYYLEYCYFYCISRQLDPEPKNGRPGRFPVHEQYPNGPGSPQRDAGQDADGDQHSSSARSRGRPPHPDVPHTPAAFLRLMLRVNAHGLTAFDYAHSPAMLQLLEWYGCVPPTYRPNPRLFRRVLASSSGGRGDAQGRREGSPDDVIGWTLASDNDSDDGVADVEEEDTAGSNAYYFDHSDADEAGDGSTRRQIAAVLAGRAREASHRPVQQRRKRRSLLRFFPVPRLALASDNFVTLLDPTGAELAATATTAPAQLLLTSGGPNSAPGSQGSAAQAEKVENEDGAEGDAGKSERQQQQHKTNRHLSTLVVAERRQQQLAQRRREQHEMAKALLFDQVTAQPLLAIKTTGKGGKATADVAASTSQRRGPANPPYLSRVVTANLRDKWEAQRHPQLNDNVLLHNALEAQRQSYLSAAARWGREGPRRGVPGGVLPILLSEEVSLLHLGLCTFDDELVSLYGELHPSSRGGTASTYGGADKRAGTAGGGRSGASLLPQRSAASAGTSPAAAAAAGVQAQLSAYSRMLLPPVLTGKAATAAAESSPHDARQPARSPSMSVREEDAKRARLLVRDERASASLGRPFATPSLTGGGGGGIDNRSSTVTAITTSQPPRLSYADIVFLLECQQFVVFPLALPTAEEDAESVGRASGGGAAAAAEDGSGPRRRSRRSTAHSDGTGIGREMEDQHGGVLVGFHGAHDAAAVIDRCTGMSGGSGDGGAGGGGRGKNHSAPPHQMRWRSRGEVPRGASDAPFLRSLLSRQAATMSDLVDVAARCYDTALLISLTPMQLCGAGSATGRSEATITMRALGERLTDTQFKQFGSRVSPPSHSNGAGAAAAQSTLETVALRNVPPFSAGDSAVAAGAAAMLTRGGGGPAAASCISNEISMNAWDGAATTTLAVSAATSHGPTNVPTLMAARLEEWVQRRWPAERKLPVKLHQARRGVNANADGDRHAFSPSPPRVTVEADVAAVSPSALDKAKPTGGVATATQQTLMRALLRHFSNATGAQLSEQMGLSIAPNYDVAEVGDAAAARRAMAAKSSATPPQKKRR